MWILIKRAGTTIVTVNITEASYVYPQLMADDIAFIEFYQQDPVALQPGDYTDILGRRYFVRDAVIPVADVNRLKYSITLYGTQHELEKALYFITDSTGVDQTADTVYNCTPQQLLNQLVVNMHRLQPTAAWQVGYCLTAPAKDITLSKNNCLEILQNAAELWETDYLVDGYVIHLRKMPIEETPTALSVGMGNGLRSLTANRSGDSSMVTRLYAYGSNLNNSTGQKLSIPPVDAVDAYDIIEGIKDFEDIYPRIICTVLAAWGLPDPGVGISVLPFDIDDYLIPGTKPQITFISGELNGLSFSFTTPDNATFHLQKYDNGGGVIIPGTAPYNAAAGDQFVISYIEMPELYIEEAKEQLYNAAVEYLVTASRQKIKLNIATHEKYFKAHGLQLYLGKTLHITSTVIAQLSAGVDISVLGYKQYVHFPYRYDNVIVGDVYFARKFGSMARVITNVTTFKNSSVGSDSYYKHVQLTAANEWVVNHRLDKNPAVTVTGSDGVERIGVITYLTPRRLKINFSIAVAGYAECN